MNKPGQAPLGTGYRCPVCKSTDDTTYLRCQWPDCPDGRDRPNVSHVDYGKLQRNRYERLNFKMHFWRGFGISSLVWVILHGIVTTMGS